MLLRILATSFLGIRRYNKLVFDDEAEDDVNLDYLAAELDVVSQMKTSSWLRWASVREIYGLAVGVSLTQ